MYLDFHPVILGAWRGRYANLLQDWKMGEKGAQLKIIRNDLGDADASPDVVYTGGQTGYFTEGSHGTCGFFPVSIV